MSLNISNYGNFVIKSCCSIICIAHNTVILGLGLGININVNFGYVLKNGLYDGIGIDVGLGNFYGICGLAACAQGKYKSCCRANCAVNFFIISS